MGLQRGLGLAGAVAALVAVLASCAQPNSGSSTLGIQSAPGRPVSLAGLPSAPVCPGPVALGNAGCTSRVILNGHGVPLASTSPAGFSPSAIRAAYGFVNLSQTGYGTTIAIVDAYDDPNAQADLDMFKSQFGISGSACPLAKVDQNGGTNYPHKDSGWALESSLDVQWACAIAPEANILLVEAKSSSFGNLMTAVQYAENHANVVSMSWGGSEFSSEASYDPYFQKANVTFTASSGDSGAGVIYPAASPYVLGVGGTTLNLSTSNAITSETAWSGSGGGVSAYEPEPYYQTSLSGGAIGDMASAKGSRGIPDVAYDADPNTGVAVYDSTGYQGVSGWFVLGGTSVGAPQWAALFALADDYHQTSLSGTSGANVASLTSPTYSAADFNYASDFNDIQTGSNCASGSTSTVSPAHPGNGKGGPPSSGGGNGGSTSVCNAGTGYDFVTGLGSPNAENLVPQL